MCSTSVLPTNHFPTKLVENTVIVKTKPAERISTLLISSSPAALSITVSGRILNENGEPVVASVMLKGTDWGTTSNDAGNFVLHHVDEKEVHWWSVAPI